MTENKARVEDSPVKPSHRPPRAAITRDFPAAPIEEQVVQGWVVQGWEVHPFAPRLKVVAPAPNRTFQDAYSEITQHAQRCASHWISDQQTGS